jgi:hypothetical protein
MMPRHNQSGPVALPAGDNAHIEADAGGHNAPAPAPAPAPRIPVELPIAAAAAPVALVPAPVVAPVLAPGNAHIGAGAAGHPAPIPVGPAAYGKAGGDLAFALMVGAAWMNHEASATGDLDALVGWAGINHQARVIHRARVDDPIACPVG